MEKRGGLSAIWRRIWQDARDYWPGLFVAAGLYFLFHFLFGAFCPSVLLTGFPCPGCGMTRAMIYFVKGQFLRSFALNPSAGLWLVWFICFFYERYVRGRRPHWIFWAAALMMVLMIIVYIYRMSALFPNKPPYVYRKDNFLAKWLPGYEQVVKRIFRV